MYEDVDSMFLFYVLLHPNIVIYKEYFIGIGPAMDRSVGSDKSRLSSGPCIITTLGLSALFSNILERFTD